MGGKMNSPHFILCIRTPPIPTVMKISWLSACTVGIDYARRFVEIIFLPPNFIQSAVVQRVLN